MDKNLEVTKMIIENLQERVKALEEIITNITKNQNSIEMMNTITLNFVNNISKHFPEIDLGTDRKTLEILIHTNMISGLMKQGLNKEEIEKHITPPSPH